jgi:hypothetical protein
MPLEGIKRKVSLMDGDLTFALVATQLFWAGTMWYSQFNTYPMFAAVSAEDFRPLHASYEQGLPIAVYLPFGIALLVGLTALIRLWAISAPIWLTVLALGLAGGVVTTAFGAAPLHIWLIENGQDMSKIQSLLMWNAARNASAMLAAASSLVIAVQWRRANARASNVPELALEGETTEPKENGRQ